MRNFLDFLRGVTRFFFFLGLEQQRLHPASNNYIPITDIIHICDTHMLRSVTYPPTLKLVSYQLIWGWLASLR